MLKEILICLEGSPSSDRAIEVGIGLAKTVGATLVGLAIVDEPDITAGAATGFGGGSYKKDRDDARLKDAHEHAQQWLDAFGRTCEQAGVEARPLELRGRPEAMILEEMQRHDLTLLGRKVNFRFETQDTDRKTRDTVLHKAGKPVIVVPEAAPAGGGAPVMIAYDGSSAAQRALHSFAESSLGRNRPLHIATVEDDGAAAWEMANRGCGLLREHGLSGTIHNIVSTLSIAEALLERRRELGAGMLVMGAYASSRISQLIWGSVTHELVEKTDVPLYLHH